jgi:hypothetical protein
MHIYENPALCILTPGPDGWLMQQHQLMKDGMTGHLDELYPSVLGPSNGWFGGDGDGWERGPYWLDGLVPLAWILDNDELKAKATPWIEDPGQPDRRWLFRSGPIY